MSEGAFRALPTQWTHQRLRRLKGLRSLRPKKRQKQRRCWTPSLWRQTVQHGGAMGDMGAGRIVVEVRPTLRPDKDGRRPAVSGKTEWTGAPPLGLLWSPIDLSPDKVPARGGLQLVAPPPCACDNAWTGWGECGFIEYGSSVKLYPVSYPCT